MSDDQRTFAKAAEAVREWRSALNLDDRLVVRNPDGADQFCEEVALVVLEAIADPCRPGWCKGKPARPDSCDGSCEDPSDG